ncbi:MAG: type II toxin-antitoxin system VapC family toxin [Acidobacteriota bacterium]
MIVADTNLIAYLFLPGDRTAAAEAVLVKDPEWAAPLLWRSEFRSVLAGYLRQGRIPLPVAQALMERAEGLLAGREFSVPSGHVLEVAAGSGCSAYDCESAVLAQDLGVPLVTTDRQILRNFRGLAHSPEVFAELQSS